MIEVKGNIEFYTITMISHGMEDNAARKTSSLHEIFKDDKGNVMYFMRRKVVDDTGQVDTVPVVSGNSLRGIMRRAIVRRVLRTLGMGPESLSRYAYDFLFTGGGFMGKSEDLSAPARQLLADLGATFFITAKTDQKVYNHQIHIIRRLMPWVSLMGGVVGRMAISSKIWVGDAFPALLHIRRLVGDVPDDRLIVVPDGRGERLLGRVSFARRDELLTPDKGVKKEERERQVTQMIAIMETLPPGVTLVARLGTILEPLTQEELGCLIVGLRELVGEGRETALLGGKWALGFGQARAQATIHVGDETLNFRTGEVAQETAAEKALDEHVKKNADTLKKLLQVWGVERDKDKDKDKDKGAE